MWCSVTSAVISLVALAIGSRASAFSPYSICPVLSSIRAAARTPSAGAAGALAGGGLVCLAAGGMVAVAGGVLAVAFGGFRAASAIVSVAARTNAYASHARHGAGNAPPS